MKTIIPLDQCVGKVLTEVRRSHSGDSVALHFGGEAAVLTSEAYDYDNEDTRVEDEDPVWLSEHPDWLLQLGLITADEHAERADKCSPP